MAISSKDIETLWGRYQSEGVSKGVSVSQYFEANGIPYHVFEKWYKKRFRQPDVVDCVVDGVPDDAMAEKERYDTERMIMRAQYAMSLIEDSWREGSPAVHKSQEELRRFSSEAGARVAAIYLTLVETCKLMKKTALDFFKGFFSMTSGGRSDYELIVQELLC